MQTQPGQIYWYLRLKHNVSDGAARGILANIQAESNFKSNAIGDGGTSFGLFQHHRVRADSLKNFAAKSDSDWSNWMVQVDFAMLEAKSLGADLQSSNAYDFSMWWTIRFERPADATRKAVVRAGTVNQYEFDPNSFSEFGYGVSSQGVSYMGGTLGDYTLASRTHQSPTGGGGTTGGSGGTTDWGNNTTFTSGSGGGGGGGGGGTAGAASSPVVLPSGYEVWEIDGVKHAVYTINGGQETSALVAFKADNVTGSVTTKVSDADARQRGVVIGGTTEQFRGLPANTSFQDVVDRFLYEAGLYGTDALVDQKIMDIIAMAVARGMGEDELTNRVKQTNWYNDHTDRQRSWNDKSDAQKEQEHIEAAGNLVSRFFTYVGGNINLMDYDTDGDGTITVKELLAGNKGLHDAALNWVSGVKTEQQIINEWLKPLAEKDEQSPWSRILRDETLAQRQWGIGIQDRAAEILNLHRRWGVQLTEDQALGMAEGVQWNEESMGQLVEDLDKQARGLYPNKPVGVDTQSWASPFLRTYSELLEQGEPDLFNNHVQSALTGGMNLGDFRKTLKQTDEWMETGNARSELFGAAGAMSRTMGFQ